MGLAGLMLISLTSLSGGKQKEKFNIEYLNKDKVKTRVKLSSLSNNELTLDDEKDAYVLNQKTFNSLNCESADSYLSNGGVIVVNDNEVSSEELKKKIDTNVIDFDYCGEKNQYGFYVYNNGEENVTVNVALGFVGMTEEQISKNESEIVLKSL